jgi:hypothetical protein
MVAAPSGCERRGWLHRRRAHGLCPRRTFVGIGVREIGPVVRVSGEVEAVVAVERVLLGDRVALRRVD